MPFGRAGTFPFREWVDIRLDIRPSACQAVTQTVLSERRFFGARCTRIGDLLKHNDYSPSTLFCIEW